MIGGVFPDIDMIWFHTIGERATHHHNYITHRPVLYLGVLCAAFLWSAATRRSGAVGTAFALGALLHLVLDSVAGKIAWEWPFSNWAQPVTVVRPTHDHWALSFMAHWYFWVEIGVLLAAIVIFLNSRNRSGKTNP